MAIKSVLFDLDGVLVDSESIYTEFWSDVERHFPTGVDGFSLKIKGTTLPSILNTYFPVEQHPAIIAMLIVYCLRGVSFAAPGGWVPQLVSVAAVVILHLWRSNTLLSIFGGTILYMVLVQAVFP